MASAQLSKDEVRVLSIQAQAVLAEEAEAEAAQLAREEAKTREAERQAELTEKYTVLGDQLLGALDAGEASADALSKAFSEVESVAAELRSVQAERGVRSSHFSSQAVRRRLSQYLSLALRRGINPAAVRFGDISLATAFTMPFKATSWREREQASYNGTGWTGHD